MSKIIIVSNRLPVQVTRRKGKITLKPSAGGLATGISSIHKKMDMLWVGWPGTVTSSSAEKTQVTKALQKEHLRPVFLTQLKVDKYYSGFCNRTIWPLFHYFVQYVLYDESLWRAYESVNQHFADRVMEFYKPGDFIWVHDYQLMLVPGMLREKAPDASIGFFLHIPFPSFEIFRSLPWREDILRGLMGSDLIGFHLFDYARHFLSSAMRLLGLEHEFSLLQYEDRTVRVDTFPLGIDYEKYAQAHTKTAVKKEISRLSKNTKHRKIILSIDRLDYSKGLLQRLKAYHLLLHRNPEYREKVQLILLVVPSRAQVESYKHLKRNLDEMVGRINGEHGTAGWTPIWYFYRSLPFNSISALYNLSDIGLVTPFRDGMNLVAKEFVASKQDQSGVIVLSEMAGAAGELSEAVLVNPNDINNIVKALEIAVNMNEDEQRQRMKRMNERLQRYDVQRWAEDFFDRLTELKQIQQYHKIQYLNKKIHQGVISRIRESKKVLVLLDYDGTLVPFVPRPEKAKPTPELVKSLNLLNNMPNIELAIISGRDRTTLDGFLHNVSCHKIAEHGAWVKEKDHDWHTIESLSQAWKEEVRLILDRFVYRTPGSFIEEKEFSLVWHYRKTDVGLGVTRANELIDTLQYMTANLNLQVLEGSKVVEVKNSGINKGRAALYFINNVEPDYILAAGDDWTDEDTFKVLPENSCSIKVGKTASAAQYNVKSYKEILKLLTEVHGANELKEVE